MPRDTLTEEQIVRTAVELLDTEGLEGLNMRALGQRLGSAATAVYWHIQSKDNLVLLATDRVWGELTLPDPDRVGWRTAAATMATDLYRMFARHTWLVQVLATHVVYGEGKARHDDRGLAVFEAAGFIGARYPHLRSRLETHAATDYAAAPEETFEFGLESLLDGLESRSKS